MFFWGNDFYFSPLRYQNNHRQYLHIQDKGMGLMGDNCI